MDFVRVKQGTPRTIENQWYNDGAAADPGTATVGITRWDGTVLVAPGTATTGTGTNPRTFNLTTTHTALLDRFTVTWTGTALGTETTYVEVAGGHVFRIDEMRALNPQLADAAKYPTDRIEDMRTVVEDAIEDEVGFALVPRYTRATLSGRYGDALRLRPYVRAIRTATVAGTALSAGDLALLTYDAGFLRGYGWPTGYSNVVVGYEHGLDTPPQRLRRAALLLAKVWLTSGPVDDRTNTFTSTEGGTFSLVTPGRGGSIFGVPEVDAAVQSSRLVAIA